MIRINVFRFLWRLSAIPLTVVVIIVFFVYFPIKWVFTGRFGVTKLANYREKNNLLYRWIEKVESTKTKSPW